MPPSDEMGVRSLPESPSAWSSQTHSTVATLGANLRMQQAETLMQQMQQEEDAPAYIAGSAETQVPRAPAATTPMYPMTPSAPQIPGIHLKAAATNTCTKHMMSYPEHYQTSIIYCFLADHAQDALCVCQALSRHALRAHQMLPLGYR